MSYLPLAHIFDRVVEELFIFHGASIGFWRGVSTTICSPEYPFVILLLGL
jgi:long-subunit acyl-CoA synthetase (AMP-forming)